MGGVMPAPAPLHHSHSSPKIITMTLAYSKLSITSAATTRLLGYAEAHARQLGVNVVIAICNEDGVLMGLRRMDGAAMISADLAQDKAYTAASFGRPTHEWYDAIKHDPALVHGLNKAARFTLLGGGLPIMAQGALIGAIGVSGGTAEDDVAIAQAALNLA